MNRQYVLQIYNGDKEPQFMREMGRVTSEAMHAQWFETYGAALDCREAFNLASSMLMDCDDFVRVYAVIRTINISVEVES